MHDGLRDQAISTINAITTNTACKSQGGKDPSHEPYVIFTRHSKERVPTCMLLLLLIQALVT
jgi:hypothetical protein